MTPDEIQALESLRREYADDTESFTGRRVNVLLDRVQELEGANERLREGLIEAVELAISSWTGDFEITPEEIYGTTDRLNSLAVLVSARTRDEETT